MGKKKGKKQPKQSIDSPSAGPSNPSEQSQQEEQSSASSAHGRDQSQQSGSGEGTQNAPKKNISKKKGHRTFTTFQFPLSSSSQSSLPSESSTPSEPPSLSLSTQSFPSLPSSSEPPLKKPLSFASLLSSKSSQQSQPPVEQLQSPSQQPQTPQAWQKPLQQPQQAWQQPSEQSQQAWQQPLQQPQQAWQQPSEQSQQAWQQPSQEPQQKLQQPLEEPQQKSQEPSEEPQQKWPQLSEQPQKKSQQKSKRSQKKSQQKSQPQQAWQQPSEQPQQPSEEPQLTSQQLSEEPQQKLQLPSEEPQQKWPHLSEELQQKSQLPSEEPQQEWPQLSEQPQQKSQQPSEEPQQKSQQLSEELQQKSQQSLEEPQQKWPQLSEQPQQKSQQPSEELEQKWPQLSEQSQKKSQQKSKRSQKKSQQKSQQPQQASQQPQPSEQPQQPSEEPQQKSQQLSEESQQKSQQPSEEPQQKWPQLSEQPQQESQQPLEEPQQKSQKPSEEPQQKWSQLSKRSQKKSQQAWQQPSEQPRQAWQQPSEQPRQAWQQPSEPPRQAWQQPSEPPRQAWQQPSEPPRQAWQQPSEPPRQAWQQPSEPPRQAWQQPSEPPRQAWQQPSEPPRQAWQQPSEPPRQAWQQPSEPPRQAWQQPSEQQSLEEPQQKWPQLSEQLEQKTQQPSQRSQKKSKQKSQQPSQQPLQLSPSPSQIPQPSSSSQQLELLPQKAESSSLSEESEAPIPFSVVHEKLTKSVAGQLALSIPTRKNPSISGTRGRPITVEVNVMALEFKNLKTNVTQYDVTITPDKPKCLMRVIFEEFRKKRFPNRHPAYDGNKIAYSANDLPFPTYINDEIIIFENGQERIFQIEMKKATSIDLSFLRSVKPGFNESLGTQSGIQALDVILRHGPLSFCFPVGRSIFWQPTGRSESLSNGMELWIGSFQSAILGWKPLLNVDVAHKGFPKSQNVMDLIKELCLRGENRDITLSDVNQNQEKIKKFLVGLKVHYVIPNIPSSKRTQVVRGFAECPRINVFSRDDGTSSTIENYFRKEKNYIIRYPTLPCLWIGPETKKIYVPPELCTIAPGQTIRRKMDEIQTSKMIKLAATSSDRRKEKIMEGFRALKINDHPTMKKEFNLSVKSEFERVPARVLDAPKLNYNNNDIVSVMKGVWRAKKFLNPSTLLDKQWTILNLVDRRIKDRDMYHLCDMLREGARTVGMFMGDALKPFQYCNNHLQALLACFDQLKKSGVKLIIVIISDYNDSYSNVKQISELRLGMLTQCIKSVTVERKLNPATIGNILLKINSKLNGVNHEICGHVRPSILSPDCILIGADVTHPSPDSKNIPSIAAVAASCDRTAFRYKIEIRLQQPRQEIISDFADIVRILLRYYYKCTGIQPKKIIIYRDGVSEGQLTQVLHHELTALKHAFQSLSKDDSYHPSVTFLVVQKRHHIRFFPTDRRNTDDRNFNVQAGTIVDTHITHPSHIDFYLVSHASIQGTARPTKYKCVFNQLDMTEDQIEELTYYLCHMFARCTRSISYPAPTYYAHLAAFRARAFIQNVPIELSKLQDEQVKVKVVLNDDVPMFYV
uniref:protein argonaute-2-like n=1 Tax=Vespula vulgaris TaxID=7454 RepID=UPI002140EBF4|nr:protein argonaute-2-like [Vespula vulgaris]